MNPSRVLISFALVCRTILEWHAGLELRRIATFIRITPLAQELPDTQLLTVCSLHLSRYEARTASFHRRVTDL